MLGRLLLSPVTGFTVILREIAHAVDEARAADRRAVMAELRELHGLIEQGAIAEADFATREAALLDRLEALSGGGPTGAPGGAEKSFGGAA